MSDELFFTRTPDMMMMMDQVKVVMMTTKERSRGEFLASFT